MTHINSPVRIHIRILRKQLTSAFRGWGGLMTQPTQRTVHNHIIQCSFPKSLTSSMDIVKSYPSLSLPSIRAWKYANQPISPYAEGEDVISSFSYPSRGRSTNLRRADMLSFRRGHHYCLTFDLLNQLSLYWPFQASWQSRDLNHVIASNL